MFCRMCGAKIPDDVHFCPECGANLKERDAAGTNTETDNSYNTSNKGSIRQGVDNITSAINSMAGESGQVVINLSDLYSEVPKKHDAVEQAKLLISGVSNENISEKDMITSWPKPWLYSRVFAILAMCFFLLIFILHTFGNINVLPTIMFIGALVVPFSVLTLFWETNIPRNISIFSVIVMFLIGGVVSFIPTMFGYSIAGRVDLSLRGALTIGVVEEIGKAVIIIYIINSKKYKYILNGLLVGACIGAGFAVFESAGYAFRFLRLGPAAFEQLIYLRAISSIGTHLMWSAMVGAGYCAVQRNYEHPNFIKFISIAIALHACWDWSGFPLPLYPRIVVLSGLAWIIVLTLVSSGLKQIERLSR